MPVRLPPLSGSEKKTFGSFTPWILSITPDPQLINKAGRIRARVFGVLYTREIC